MPYPGEIRNAKPDGGMIAMGLEMDMRSGVNSVKSELSLPERIEQLRSEYDTEIERLNNVIQQREQTIMLLRQEIDATVKLCKIPAPYQRSDHPR